MSTPKHRADVLVDSCLFGRFETECVACSGYSFNGRHRADVTR